MKKLFSLLALFSLAIFVPTISVDAAGSSGCRAYFGTKCVQYYGEAPSSTTGMPNNRDYRCHAYFGNKCIQYRYNVTRPQPMTFCQKYWPYYANCYQVRKY